MSSDEEDEVHIQHGDEKETFGLADANDAKKVRERFFLPYEPACVFTVSKKSKRVNFGELIADMTYRLEKEEKIPNTKNHTKNAMILSNAVYQADPTAYLNCSSTSHTIHTVSAISQDSPQKVMLAVGQVGGKNTLYVAFRGTVSWEDLMSDADIELEHKDALPGGKFHSGFNRRANVLPIQNILFCAAEGNCDTIVTCGHSLGGAVSSISAIMLHFGKSKDLEVFNITFGCPFFANETVRKTCKERRIDQRMIHYVGHQDVVPGILSLGHTIAELERKLNNLTGMKEKLLTKSCEKLSHEKILLTGGSSEAVKNSCSHFLSMAKQMSSFVLQNIPWPESTGGPRAHVEVLYKLSGTILSDIKETEIGRLSS